MLILRQREPTHMRLSGTDGLNFPNDLGVVNWEEGLNCQSLETDKFNQNLFKDWGNGTCLLRIICRISTEGEAGRAFIVAVSIVGGRWCLCRGHGLGHHP